jgi:transposase
VRRRDFLAAKQMSTGGRTILGPISKRGNRYLRMLFVQAARAVLLRPQSWQKHGLKLWIEAAARRLNRFKLAIALANKIHRQWRDRSAPLLARHRALSSSGDTPHRSARRPARAGAEC